MFQQPPPGTVFKRGRAVQVFPSLGPTRRRVPRLEGSTLTEARRQLEAAELVVGRVSEVESGYYLRGRVLAQSPAAYSDAAPGAAVSVLLSTGPAPAAFVMPDLIGAGTGRSPTNSAGRRCASGKCAAGTTRASRRGWSSASRRRPGGK